MITLDWRSCKSVSDTTEQLALERWVKEKSDKEQDELLILEIGSYHGESTAILAQFGTVISIDLHGHPQDGFAHYEDIGQVSFQPFAQNMIRLGVMARRVHSVVSGSEFLDLWPKANFDVVFVDACHTYHAVIKDLVRVEYHLDINGILICDDYRRPPMGSTEWNPEEMRKVGLEPWEGAVQAIDEFRESYGFEIVDHVRGKVLLRRKNETNVK